MRSMWSMRSIIPGKAVEVAAVAVLLAMRTASTEGMAFVPRTPFNVSSGMADKSLPENIMSVEMEREDE